MIIDPLRVCARFGRIDTSCSVLVQHSLIMISAREQRKISGIDVGGSFPGFTASPRHIRCAAPPPFLQPHLAHPNMCTASTPLTHLAITFDAMQLFGKISHAVSAPSLFTSFRVPYTTINTRTQPPCTMKTTIARQITASGIRLRHGVRNSHSCEQYCFFYGEVSPGWGRDRLSFHNGGVVLREMQP